VVVSFCLFLNPLRADKLTPREQFIMAYGGLRGGIAFFLAMSLSADIFPQRKLFITTTIVVVYFTVIILVSRAQ
jgi:NhaP-type Na+/H+ or K+/H+ antiporter